MIMREHSGWRHVVNGGTGKGGWEVECGASEIYDMFKEK